MREYNEKMNSQYQTMRIIMNSDHDEADYETRCGNYFSYCLDEKLDDVFTMGIPLIICSLHLTCYCYMDTPLENKRAFVYITADENGIITYERLFREYDMLMGCELERLKKCHNTECHCNHSFIEVITKKSDIHYELDCGS